MIVKLIFNTLFLKKMVTKRPCLCWPMLAVWIVSLSFFVLSISNVLWGSLQCNGSEEIIADFNSNPQPPLPPTFSGWGNGAEMTGRPPPLIFLTPLSIVDLTRPIWSGGSYYCVSSSRRYKRFSPHNGAHFRAFQFTPRSNATTKVSINRLGLSQSSKAFQITPCSKCFNTMHCNGSVTCCPSVLHSSRCCKKKPAMCEHEM